MIAQKIERHFSRTVQAQKQSKNNMKFVQQSDTFLQVNEEASQFCQDNLENKKSVTTKQIKQNETQIQGQEETFVRVHDAQNDSQTVTPLAVPEVQDLEQIPSLEHNLFPIENSKNKQKMIKRKVIHKRFKSHQTLLISMDSNHSLPTALDLQLEGEVLEKNETHNKSFSNNQKPIHKSNKELKEGELFKQIRIEDFNQPKNRKTYYTDKLISLIKGDQVDTFMAQMYINHFIQTYGILQKSKLLKQPESFQILNKINPQIIKQKTLVIDLDETLVHCNESQLMPKDLVININLNDTLTVKAEISVRPYAQQFLQNMAQYFEIMIYTASNEDYANQIIDYLDPTQQLVKYRLYRNDCINLSEGCHIKDLRTLNRNLKDVILIDNSAYSFVYQLNNGIPIIPYLDNKKDDELIELENYLMELQKVDDIRIENEKSFHFQQIQNSSSIQQAVNYLMCNRK
ncbi:unnamed protein product [Paramecium pentaurelia]|uniref:FCP1 homology domain-containing protein n=1 Tax=Paramecium pentaurelia TaxID=43138 RepID=A0A8S1X571_9CILI|nr:unnamed protein product [Paramecium pentaurelia]